MPLWGYMMYDMDNRIPMSWEGELVDQVIKQKIERVEIKTHDCD